MDDEPGAGPDNGLGDLTVAEPGAAMAPPGELSGEPAMLVHGDDLAAGEASEGDSLDAHPALRAAFNQAVQRDAGPAYAMKRQDGSPMARNSKHYNPNY